MKAISSLILWCVVVDLACAGKTEVPDRLGAEERFQQAIAAANEGNAARTLDAIEAVLQAGVPATRILTQRAFTDLHVETRFHDLIRAHAVESSIVLVTPDEPGTPMVVSGVVRNGNGTPLAGALVHVFHADTKGEYTPTRPMDEPHSRIFGYMRTDADGRYEFRTVRPGGYREAVQLNGKARLIPEHIHFEVEAEGFEPAQFQMAFDDDPRMDDHWRNDWAPGLSFPIVKVTRDATGVHHCSHDIVLQRRSTASQ